MWRFARATGIAERLRVLHRPRPWRTLASAAGDWALIVAAGVAVAWFAVWALPFALIVIGSRQRALGNLLHDASHRSFDRHRTRARWLADVLFCWPLWISMPLYRREHNRHHRYLGDPTRDPDFIHDATRSGRDWLELWWEQIVSPRMLRLSLFAHLPRMDAASLAGVTLWWGAVLGAIAWSCSADRAVGFAALWMAARALVFHPITAFREISDHVGLQPGSLIGFSRNHPFGGFLAQIIHPHHNGYHLLHHLNPGMPFHAFPRAHALLLAWPPYAEGEQCSAYFRGPVTAIRSWSGRTARAVARGQAG